jgi:hypothetical protein
VGDRNAWETDVERELPVCMDGELQEMVTPIIFESCSYNSLTEPFF